MSEDYCESVKYQEERNKLHLLRLKFYPGVEVLLECGHSHIVTNVKQKKVGNNTDGKIPPLLMRPWRCEAFFGVTLIWAWSHAIIQYQNAFQNPREKQFMLLAYADIPSSVSQVPSALHRQQSPVILDLYPWYSYEVIIFQNKKLSILLNF